MNIKTKLVIGMLVSFPSGTTNLGNVVDQVTLLNGEEKIKQN
jgi:hypothetical protein